MAPANPKMDPVGTLNLENLTIGDEDAKPQRNTTSRSAAGKKSNRAQAPVVPEQSRLVVFVEAAASSHCELN